MTFDEAKAFLDKYAGALSEHFGAVQLLASWEEGGFTHYTTAGVGNFYARQGMAHEFITANVSGDAARQIAQEIHKREDE